MDKKTWQYVQEVQRQRAERDSSAGKTRKKRATRKSPRLTTSSFFGKKLQSTTRLVPVVQDGKSLDGLQMGTTTIRDTAMIEFDALYRPYVYYLLERNYFFRWKKDEQGGRVLRNGSIDAEEVYDDVIVTLFGGALWRFDFDGARVGRGAFRKYLSDIVRSVFCEMVKPDLVPVLDEDGNQVFTDQFAKDKKGSIKKDENGNPIRKPKMVSRFVFEQEQLALAHVKGLPQLFATRKDGKQLFVCLYRLALVAYLHTIGQKSATGRTEWQEGAMRAVFEEMESSASVIRRLQEAGDISGREAFDTAKSYFLAKWRTCWDKLCKPIISKKSVKDGRAVIRHLNVTEDVALRYIDGLEKEVEEKYGKQRVMMVRRNFKKSMLMLVQEADERESEKNAKYYE